jgi:hypothetical protein
MVETALLEVPALANSLIYGRQLLERLIATCRRAGVKRFLIIGEAERGELLAALGSYRYDPAVEIIKQQSPLIEDLPGESLCLMLRGNLILTVTALKDLFGKSVMYPAEVVAFKDTLPRIDGIIAAGPLHLFLSGNVWKRQVVLLGQLPMVLDSSHGVVVAEPIPDGPALSGNEFWKVPGRG